MDIKAIAETSVNLWEECRQAFLRMYNQEPSDEQLSMIFEQANDVYITNIIEQRRSKGQKGQQEQTPPQRGAQGRQKQPKQKADVRCRSCGRQLTVGEKEYCDNNNEPYMCYQCSHQ